MKVVYLVTAEPNSLCGVVDYANKLAAAVSRMGFETVVEKTTTWSFSFIKRIRLRYESDKDCIFHLQYPTLGMGKSLAPALLPLLMSPSKAFITLHEYEQFHIVRKYYFLPASLLTSNIIFTNEHERNVFQKIFPWKKSAYNIIPIGNNIDVSLKADSVVQRPRLVYFGQIAQNKGIEFYLQTVAYLREQGIDCECLLMGALVDPEGELTKSIQRNSQLYNIQCLFNMDAEAVSIELLKSSIALLPFPTGVGDKRGSALACLKHNLSLITKHGTNTPSWWTQATWHCNTFEEAGELVKDILIGKRAKVPNIRVLKESLIAREWDAIASKHVLLYKKA
ncbi:hypothetical protein [Desulfovibrio sp. UCD-KL4C]|uniref:hypothetical protein n=1 Tax=Desulfovibrio sp. UCD-KL4C TaxID=2578120 RepID=UPI0025BB8BE1|nr:hypothetical protein [Desulfovibrio sp. UCD-KL4C]